MIKRTVVIRKNSCPGQPNTKRKVQSAQVTPKKHAAGFISPVFVVLACTAFSGLFYIYSVNLTAIKGVAILDAEKKVAESQNDNEKLKIQEAELKSLYNIEDASKSLNMVDQTNVKYVEENSTVAYR